MIALSAASTHLGRRSNNEDAFAVSQELGLYVVADGVGGYEGGEIASRLAVESVRDFVSDNRRDPDGTWPIKADRTRSWEENLLDGATVVAHRAIAARRVGVLEQMGSTVVAAMLAEHRLTIAHVGDSRAYVLRDHQLRALTRDHSYLADLEASGWKGDRRTFPYKNQITRALGLEGACRAEVSTHAAREGDVVLLCTDGLYDPLDDGIITRVLDACTPEAACAQLTSLALEAGGTDNLTAIVVHLTR
jgi:PPM family protein phosphatase